MDVETVKIIFRTGGIITETIWARKSTSDFDFVITIIALFLNDGHSSGNGTVVSTTAIVSLSMFEKSQFEI